MSPEVAVVVIKPFPGERQDCLSGRATIGVPQRARRGRWVGVGAVDVAQPAKQGRGRQFWPTPRARPRLFFPVFQDDLALQESQIVRTRRLNKAPESKDPFPIVCEVQ